MARNGSGVYTPPAASYPAVSGTLIEAAKFNAVIDDISTGLTESVAINGQTAMTGNLPMGAHKITGLADGVTATDACAYGQAGAAATAGMVAASTKATPVDADLIPLADSAASFGLKNLTWANLKATVYAALGVLTAAGTDKPTPVDADMFVIADSAASNATKKLTWANVKVVLKAYFDTFYYPIPVNPSFSAHKNASNQAIASAAYVPVTFGTEEFDTNSNFASSAFTPTVAGKYLLTAAVCMTLTNNGHSIIAAIYKNGAIYKESKIPLVASAASVGTAMVTIVAEANGSSDVFTVCAYTSDTAGGTIDGASTATYFTGARIT